MTTISIPHKKPGYLTLQAWAGSIFFHGTLIFLSVAFLSHMTAKPSPKDLNWKVSLVHPPPPADPVEHVQTVKRPTPTHHKTVSRPQPKRHVLQQRRLIQRQPSTYQTAVATRQKLQPVKTDPQVQPRVQRSDTISQSKPKLFTQARNTVSTKRSIPPSHRTTAARPAPTRTQQAVQTAQVQIAHFQTARTQAAHVQTAPVQSAQVETTASPVKTNKARTRAKTVKSGDIQSVKTMTAMVAAVQMKSLPQHHMTVVEHQTSPASVSQPRTTSSKAISRSVSQKLVQMRTGLPNLVSAEQPKKRALKQSAIYAGSPERQTVKKRRVQSKPTAIARKSKKTQAKETTKKHVVSDGLSKEVLAFLKLLREKIEQHRQYPRMAKRLGYQGTTTVSFALSHAGDLTLLKIAEPSGHSILDEAALDAVQNIAPLRPPKTIGGTAIEIPVAFELSR